MDSAIVRTGLIAVLTSIQKDSGLDCPKLTGDLRPTEKLPSFTSKIWPVATSLLAEEIGVDIPNDVNIFFDASTKTPLSIDQMVVLVCDLADKKSDKAPQE